MTEVERNREVSPSFIKQRGRNVRRIIRSLIKEDKISKASLEGYGLDLGAWIGTSTAALRKFGGEVTAVEPSAVQTQKGIVRGLIDPDNLIIGRAENHLAQFPEGRLDYVTFFGVSEAADLSRITELAERVLKDGGFFLATSYSGMEKVIEGLASEKGEKIKPNSDYWWDQVGYLYRKKAPLKLE